MTNSRIAPWASPRAQRRLAEVEAAVSADLSAAGVADTVGKALAAHAAQVDDDGIVLYAGTNVLSPAAAAANLSSVSSRPSMGWPGEKYQVGLEHLDTLEVLAPLLVAELMEGSHAEVRLQSATLANLAVYTAFARPGDKIAVLPEAAGGHASHHPQGVPAVRGLTVVDLPYDPRRLDLDYPGLPGFLRVHRPRIVVIGASMMLFPHDVATVRAACDEVGAILLYDASHMAGLVAGRVFQRPLHEGAHVLTFSTYKSFGGPSGGCVVTRDPELAERVSTVAYPGMLANYDAGRLGALAVTAAELAERGPSYAAACLANARALAASLHDEGFRVAGRDGEFTRSHHIAVDALALGGGDAAGLRLGEAGVYLSGIGLPWQRADEGLRGLRIGTQEITRRGFTPQDQPAIASLMRRALLDGEPPHRVRADAVALRREVNRRTL
ncbi:glycine hydroxymethyltransferase [Saccharothrix tamanrassetensis]|uniref:Glycine hydroxymethyltransferase n=1 Tax=Saccharothrix tamanrassetensis TaxID=1051531 RepID=A0A841C8P7_9PSEU|nr:DegT/DnrJ/EryC1/StrS family aminotransferase [Saccharothrix tamanrassetensis]MBB5953491.1 glycine hydroxymethyltransferase [Saccharothrix tamanrassetensis]